MILKPSMMRIMITVRLTGMSYGTEHVSEHLPPVGAIHQRRFNRFAVLPRPPGER